MNQAKQIEGWQVCCIYVCIYLVTEYICTFALKIL